MNKPDFEIFATRENKQGKTRWTQIGVGFLNKDGSINLDLVAAPIDGRCQVRAIKDRTPEQR